MPLVMFKIAENELEFFDVGVNVTPIVHECPASNPVTPFTQVVAALAVEKLAESAPEIEKLIGFKLPLPEFVTVTDWIAETPSMLEVKLSEAGLLDIDGAAKTGAVHERTAIKTNKAFCIMPPYVITTTTHNGLASI